ncbi:protein of unknown function [Nitrospira japonica]|uniref:Uncharacterized protein n=1 Tax=Nitrospira japonica TaxID=1325564 RepID=A0A1W1I0H6_9BACT|nr:protein of unknown function [Nitrospira japonica]
MPTTFALNCSSRLQLSSATCFAPGVALAGIIARQLRKVSVWTDLAAASAVANFGAVPAALEAAGAELGAAAGAELGVLPAVAPFPEPVVPSLAQPPAINPKNAANTMALCSEMRMPLSSLMRE